MKCSNIKKIPDITSCDINHPRLQGPDNIQISMDFKQVKIGFDLLDIEKIEFPNETTMMIYLSNINAMDSQLEFTHVELNQSKRTITVSINKQACLSIKHAYEEIQTNGE